MNLLSRPAPEPRFFSIFNGNSRQTKKLSYKLFLNIGLDVSVYTDHPQVLKSSTMRYTYNTYNICVNVDAATTKRNN